MTIKGNKDVQDVYHAIESNDWVREPDQDPLFANTILFMSSVGNNGANNNVYLDSSTNNFTITRNGDTYQGSVSPHNPNGWSAFFDGNGDSLSYTGGSSLNFGTSDFTIELWGYLTNTGTFSAFLRPDDTGSFPEFGYDFSAGLLKFDARNGVILNTTVAMPVQQWVHLAVSRSGTTLRQFINGVQVGSVTNSTNFASTTGLIRVGGSSFSAAHSVLGYISNFRVVKGSAVYTGNFTPPSAPLTAISNTSLLTLQSNSFKDNSTNNLTITSNGNTKILPISPFRMDTLYNANTHGGSAYFDGTGDYLSIPYNSAFAFNGNFTVEFWLNFSSHNNHGGIVAFCRSDSITGWQIIFNNANDTLIFEYTGGSLTTNTALAKNSWYHVALVRNGSTVTVYINGRSDASTTASGTFDPSNSSLLIGVERTVSLYTAGYISNLRILKGSAVYTGNFTPPSAPVTTAGDATIYSSTANVNTTFAAANTSLLCNFTNGGIIDLTGKNNIYTVGATQVSTSIFKDSKSFYFDGSGYYYFTDDIQYMYAKPITIEAWMYPTTSGTTRTFIEENTGGDSGEQFIGLTSGNVFYFEQRSSHGYPVGGASTIGISTTATVNSNTWTHVAIVFSTTGVRMYVNGVLSGSNAGVRYWNNAARKLNLGIQGYGFGNYIGYIEDFRITLGERYKANFTPLKLKRY